MTTEPTYFIHELSEEEENDLNYDYELIKKEIGIGLIQNINHLLILIIVK